MPTRKRPTPIRKAEPSIIEFPAPHHTPKVISTNATDLTLNNQLYGNNATTSIPHPDPDTQRITPDSLDDADVLYAFVQQCVQDALHVHDTKLARAFYKVVMDWPIAEIMVMGEGQFEALVRSVMEAQ